VKFDAGGNYVKSWGEPGSEPGQFSVPHGIAFGPDGHLYVADRGNARVQIFDTEGAVLGVWKSDELGRPWSIAFSDEGEAFVVDGGDQPAMPPDRARILEVDATGAVLSSFGSFGNQDGEMIYPHDIAVDHTGAVYVVEVGIGRRAQKFVRK
jgi:DNA-binding beta-propeller fold protein YncE